MKSALDKLYEELEAGTWEPGEDRQAPEAGAATPEPVDLAPCGSPHCAGCYDVGDGRKIHPPKAGMDHAEAAAPPQRKVAVPCWHCDGRKACHCSACYQTGACVTCKGTGQVWRWVQ